MGSPLRTGRPDRSKTSSAPAARAPSTELRPSARRDARHAARQLLRGYRPRLPPAMVGLPMCLQPRMRHPPRHLGDQRPSQPGAATTDLPQRRAGLLVEPARDRAGARGRPAPRLHRRAGDLARCAAACVPSSPASATPSDSGARSSSGADTAPSWLAPRSPGRTSHSRADRWGTCGIISGVRGRPRARRPARGIIDDRQRAGHSPGEERS